ncbi:MAG: hypothetical protein ACRD21_15230 [Vicinamibacteria bacterium]
MWKSGVLGLMAALWLSMGPAAGAQTLAEVAKKERERRARLAKEEPPVEVIREKELESARGESLSIAGSEASAGDAAPPLAIDAEPRTNEGKLSEKEIRDLRQAWTRIWREQMDQAQQELSQAEGDVYQCRSASRYVFVPIAVDCDGVDMRLAEAEARLKEVESQRYNWETLLPRNPPPR